MNMDTEESKRDQNMEVDADDSSSNGSNSPEALSEDEDEVDESEITRLQEQIQLSPYVYDDHIKLISLLRKSADLDRLREAREKMSEFFPLAPELWLDWLTDEEKVAVTDDEKQSLISLFERAVKDYSSVSIWLEYVQFVIGLAKGEEGVKNVRYTFEKALTAVGIHVTQGSLIWDAYREFESALLSSLQVSESTSDAKQLEEIAEQQNKIFSLFRRQLSVPLLYMEKTYKEFQETFPEKEDTTLEQRYQKACKKLEALMPYENALFQSESPHLEEYKSYIQYEVKERDPIRIQNLYERALVENCLIADLWFDYTSYLDNDVKIDTITLEAHEKAVQNCPWSHLCWKKYILALERHSQPHEKIIECFTKAFAAGFTTAEEYQEVWLVHLDYMRRRIKWDEDHDKELEQLRTTFERAVDHLTKYFVDSDSHCAILQYWAKVEAKYCKDVSRGREIWNDIMNHGHHAEAQMWLNFATFERIYGDVKHYRKLLLKALHSASDWPEMVGNQLLTFEREEGTLESLDHAMEKYNIQMKRVQERRQRIADKEAERLKEEAEQKKHHKQQKKSGKKSVSFVPESAMGSDEKIEKDIKMDSEGFKIPLPPIRGQTSANSEENKKRVLPEKYEPDRKRRKVEQGESDYVEHGSSVKHNTMKDKRSIFLSNLAYTTEEENIREMFSPVGSIEEIRLVRDYKGRSKGYCYVVFSSQEEAEKALKMDRNRLDGRPVFVSRCEDKRSGASSSKIKYSVGLEKNKLFVKGLPFETTEAEITNIFKEFGALKEVRLVTYRNGHSKGIAYVDFEDESSASAAVVKTDGMKIGEHILSVAISNPPERKSKGFSDRPRSGVTLTSLLGGGGSSELGSRGRGRTQLSLLPRSLQRAGAQQSSTVSKSETKSVQNGDSTLSVTSKQQKLSNDDFRSMLMKK